ncbi:U-box domain-containing protein 6 [Morus notabilis]|uniref:U-box domain-containing protein 6 n=1 Tax=Morus notabilis TaxID=981085 RepID=UPI000CECF191|nr:U-box domain-containing protein 6 [Morus notabilis]
MENVVLENLFSDEREARIRGANELANLGSKQRHKLAERGIIEPLISMIHSQDCDAIEAALFALLSLAFGSERSKSRIVKCGAIPALINLLQCQNISLIEPAVTALLILSSCNANKLPIASSGAIQILVAFLNEDYSNDDNVNDNISIGMQTKLDAIATLHNLSTSREIVPLLVSSGLVFSLLQLIHCSEKSSEYVGKAIALLEDIVSLSKDALQETAGAPGAIQALVESVEDGSLQCREHAVRILLFICKSCREKYRGLILREGVMPGLLQLSVDGTWKAKSMAGELLLLLRECSSYGSKNKQSKHKMIEQIMQEIDAEEGEAVDTTTLRLVEKMIAKLSA